MTTDFSGRTALVTGAGRGIGRAIALGLAGAGAGLVLVARSADQLAETRDMLLAQGTVTRTGSASFPLTSGDEDARGRAAAAAAEHPAGIDILINNAGIVEPLGAAARHPCRGVGPAIEVNVIGPAAWPPRSCPACSGGLGPDRQRLERIVAPPAGMIRGNAYVATKAALEAHTVNLAAELERNRGHRQRLPARRYRHRDAGLDPPAGPRAHRRRPARAVRQEAPPGRPSITPEHSAAGLLARLGGAPPGPSGMSALPRPDPDPGGPPRDLPDQPRKSRVRTDTFRAALVRITGRCGGLLQPGSPSPVARAASPAGRIGGRARRGGTG